MNLDIDINVDIGTGVDINNDRDIPMAMAMATAAGVAVAPAIDYGKTCLFLAWSEGMDPFPPERDLPLQPHHSPRRFRTLLRSFLGTF